MALPDTTAADAADMGAAAQGDRQAFSRLSQRHAGWLLAFTQRLLGNRAAAEETVQQTWLQAWEAAPGWEPRARLSTWLYQIAYRLCLDQLRRESRWAGEVEEDWPDPAPDGEARASQAQQTRLVQDALAQLPPRQRAALVLCYYQELSQGEAAALLEVSEGALESLLVRARSTLRRALAPLRESAP